MKKYVIFLIGILCTTSCKDADQSPSPTNNSNQIAAQDSYDRRRDDLRRQQRQYDINRDRRLREEQQAAQRRMQAQKQEQQAQQQRLDTAKQEDKAAQDRLNESRQVQPSEQPKSDSHIEPLQPAPEPSEAAPLPGPT